MGVRLNQIPRAEKREIAGQLRDNLAARAKVGPAEPGLDAYIPELTAVTRALDTYVSGSVLAEAERVARLSRLDMADDEVDTLYRHIEGHIHAEALRRHGPNVMLAHALHQAAFPDGLAHVGDPIAAENRACRASLAVLRSSAYAPIVKAVALPLVWLDAWDEALTESEAAHADVERARTAKRGNVDAGRGAEADWVELMVRLRRYVASRARRSDTARVREGEALLAPLLDATAKLRAAAAARATRRDKPESARNGQPSGRTPV